MEEGYKVECQESGFYLCVYAWSYINTKFSIPEVEFFSVAWWVVYRTHLLPLTQKKWSSFWMFTRRCCQNMPDSIAMSVCTCVTTKEMINGLSWNFKWEILLNLLTASKFWLFIQQRLCMQLESNSHIWCQTIKLALDLKEQSLKATKGTAFNLAVTLFLISLMPWNFILLWGGNGYKSVGTRSDW